jgi:UDP-GlcNAc:undecaprenyl-phosphate/decaprenyl-phosphate GlcNAc-1-phosphate transferase
MRLEIVVFALALFVAAGLTPLVIQMARRRGLVDRGDARKVHKRPTPRLGGIAIVSGFFAPLLSLPFLSADLHRFFAQNRSLWVLLACGAAIALLGLFDDLKGASPKQKFLVQIAVAVVMVTLGGYRIENLQVPFGGLYPVGMLAGPISVLWIVGIINAVNLIDGLDGLAGGVALIVVVTNLILGVVHGDATTILVMTALAGGIIGFLFYNLNPAQIFMGDTGSLFLGFVLAAGSLRTSNGSSSAWALLVPVLALGLPIADTLLAFTRRALRGQSPFHPDREHIHHKLLDLGLTHRQVVLALYGTCVCLCSAALLLSFSSSRANALIVVVVATLAAYAVRQIGVFKPRPVEDPAADLRAAISEISDRLQHAKHISEVLECVSAITPAVGAAHVSAWTSRSAGGLAATSAGVALPRTGESSWLRARYPLSEVGGFIEVTWSDGRDKVAAHEEAALSDVSGRLASALRRVTNTRSDTPLAVLRPVAREVRATDIKPALGDVRGTETSPGVERLSARTA